MGRFKGLFPYPAKSFGRAFFLNSIAVSISTGIGIYTKYRLDKDERDDLEHGKKTGIIILTTFGAAFLSYMILYLIFGFGRGMMTQTT